MSMMSANATISEASVSSATLVQEQRAGRRCRMSWQLLPPSRQAPACRPATVANSAPTQQEQQQQHQPQVKLVATDVDGTLLSSQQQLLPRVQRAVQSAVELGVPVRRLVRPANDRPTGGLPATPFA